MKHGFLKKIEAVAIGGTMLLSTIGHVTFAMENNNFNSNFQQNLFRGEGWKYNGRGTLYIENDSSMLKDYSYYGVEQPWRNFKDEVRKIVIDYGVSKISGGAFCNFANLKEVIIPSSVYAIESKAFLNCGNLSEIRIPNSVKFMGDSVFCGCSNLKSVILSKNLFGIGGHAFDSCTSLSKIVIPKKVKYIGNKAFYNCSNLTNFIFKDFNELNNIGEGVFEFCNNLSNIEIS